MKHFATIRARAKRKGGDAELNALLPKVCFVLSMDVVACLRDVGLDISKNPSSKKDLRKIQEPAQRLGRGDWVDLSRIYAMSIGEAPTLPSPASPHPTLGGGKGGGSGEG